MSDGRRRLADCAAGDRLIIHQAGGFRTLDTVERLTRTQVVTRKGRRFRLADGREVGRLEVFDTPLAYPASPAEVLRHYRDMQVKIAASRFHAFERAPSGVSAASAGAAIARWRDLDSQYEELAAQEREEDRP